MLLPRQRMATKFYKFYSFSLAHKNASLNTSKLTPQKEMFLCYFENKFSLIQKLPGNQNFHILLILHI